MREPAVVRQLRVTKMSLCAMGTPVKGPASLPARRTSAALACARVRSRSTCRKALRSLAAMRSRNRVASSVAEILRACSCADSSLRVSLCMESVTLRSCGPVGPEADGGWREAPDSFDDLGHQVQAILGGRGRLLVVVAAIGFGHGIFAQAQCQRGFDGGDGVRQRFHAGGIDGLHLLHQAKMPLSL